MSEPTCVWRPSHMFLTPTKAPVVRCAGAVASVATSASSYWLVVPTLNLIAGLTLTPLCMTMAPRIKPREPVSLFQHLGAFSLAVPMLSHTKTVTGFEACNKIQILLTLTLNLTLTATLTLITTRA